MKKYRLPLVLLPSQHLAIKARINAKKALLLLDTGASNTCVDVNRQGHFGLDSSHYDLKGTGAGAANLTLWQAQAECFQIGRFKRMDFSLLLMDLSVVNQAMKQYELPAIDGIIGADVLVMHKAKIDYESLLLELVID